MKTTTEVLKEIGIERTELISPSGYMQIEQAMRTYAEQAIDRCAKVVDNNSYYIRNEIGEEIIQTKILKVKSELK